MKIPSATYRLQFHHQFTFSNALAITDYLKALGISDIYASPIFKAKKGSHHGYDVVDPTEINPEIGGYDGFVQLHDRLKLQTIGWLQDIVPNHMSFDSENQYLMDVLEHGALSRYYRFFDIDWDHPYEHLRGKLLTPFLGEYYGFCLDKKEIQLQFLDGGFSIRYYELVLPIKIDSYLSILSSELNWLEIQLGRGHNDFLQFLELTQSLKDLSSVNDPTERYRLTSLIKSRLWNLYNSHPVFKNYFELILARFNGSAGDPRSFDRLDQLLQEQFFRLSYWKFGNEELNYRRFFTVNSLICLNMNKKEVFEHTHRLILNLVKEGKITGLRIDHIDGLYNPIQYLEQLRAAVNDAYTVVEKILDLYEDLPERMPVQGTTGYDFLNYINGIFVDPKNAKLFTKNYITFTGMNKSYHELVGDKKRLFMGRHMAGDIDNLAQLLKKILSYDRYGRDMSMYSMRRAIVEIMAQFPIYRTYINNDQILDSDKIYIKEAAVKARNLNANLLHELNFIEKVLLLDYPGNISDDEKQQWLYCTRRFQQFSGPLMAKGAEDTTFYIFNRLLSLNEVGGDPSQWGIPLNDLHKYLINRQKQWPHALNTLATHDTKRGEDVRARLNILSELPKEWNNMLRVWAKINKNYKMDLGRIKAPEKNDEYLIYQTLLGAYPFLSSEVEQFKTRMKEYIIKAVREAKVHTAWIKPDAEYENGCINFVEKILTDQKFLESFQPFQQKIAHYGIFNSLSQTLLKLTSPGVPDIYQGAELWDLSLVDPDNRRPVDFKQRQEFLKKFQDGPNPPLLKEIIKNKADGRLKLFLTHHCLKTRNQHLELFQTGEYIPLTIAGDYPEQVVAFLRKTQNRQALIVVPRFSTYIINETELPLGHIWKNTYVQLPPDSPNSWQNVLTGSTINGQENFSIGSILNHFPVGLLINTM